MPQEKPTAVWRFVRFPHRIHLLIGSQVLDAARAEFWSATWRIYTRRPRVEGWAKLWVLNLNKIMRVTARFILSVSRILYVSENAIYQGPRILSIGAVSSSSYSVHEEKHVKMSTTVHVSSRYSDPGSQNLPLSNSLGTCNLNYQSAIISVIL